MFGSLGSPTRAKQTRFRHPSYTWQVTIYRIELKWDQTIFLHDVWLTVNDHVSKYASYVQVFLLILSSYWDIKYWEDIRRRIAWFIFWAIELSSIYCMDISVLSCLCMYKLVISWHSPKPNHDILGAISCSLSDDED